MSGHHIHAPPPSHPTPPSPLSTAQNWVGTNFVNIYSLLSDKKPAAGNSLGNGLGSNKTQAITETNDNILFSV